MPDSKKLAQSLQALLDAAATLNSRSDMINATLQAVETQIIESHLGLEAWLEADEHRLVVRSGGLDASGCAQRAYVELGFARLADGWHLAAREWQVDIDTDGDETNAVLIRAPYPLAQASRMERIAALRVLPDLNWALQGAALLAIQTIDEAQKSIAC